MPWNVRFTIYRMTFIYSTNTRNKIFIATSIYSLTRFYLPVYLSTHFCLSFHTYTYIYIHLCVYSSVCLPLFLFLFISDSQSLSLFVCVSACITFTPSWMNHYICGRSVRSITVHLLLFPFAFQRLTGTSCRIRRRLIPEVRFIHCFGSLMCFLVQFRSSKSSSLFISSWLVDQDAL